MIDFTKEKPMSVADVRHVFGVSRAAVENWFARGLEKSKIGGKVFTSLEAIQRFSVPAVQVTPRPRNRSRRQAEAARRLAELLR